MESNATNDIPSHINNSGELTGKLKIHIVDYPKFSGKNQDWPKFFETFSAICELQHLDSILVENALHDDDFSKNPKYKDKCEKLFSILKRCCAEGMALYKIKKFDVTRDGYKAWHHLCNHYYACGDVSSYVTTLMDQLINLKLEPNKPGGIEQYIAKFESLLLHLEEAKSPVVDAHAITMFLNGIQDRTYEAYKTTCRANLFDLNKCIINLRREALGQISGISAKPRRSNYTASNYDNTRNTRGNNNENSVPHIPSNIWQQMSRPQHEAYLNALKKSELENSKNIEYM